MTRFIGWVIMTTAVLIVLFYSNPLSINDTIVSASWLIAGAILAK